MTERLATYRLQLGPAVGFDRAAEVSRYLKDLGISHLYLSPCLQAAPGSTHGYDLVDPTRPGAELGGAEAHRRLCAEVNRLGLGVMVDVVSNHMAIAGRANPWWWDVLERGPASAHAKTFDVDWAHVEATQANRVLLPVLEDHYGRVLEAGLFHLERRGASVVLRYREHAFPVALDSLASLFLSIAAIAGSDELAFLARGLESLPPVDGIDTPTARVRAQDEDVIRTQLARLFEAEPALARAVDDGLRRVSGSADELDALHEAQHYRLAYWRAGSAELGYRRFFDIDSLIALRLDDPEVFENAHRTLLEWVHAGCVDAMRIDHIDGLRDPEGTLRRLHQEAPDCWLVVEKILEADEVLPASWPVAGTTGYEWMAEAARLFVDPAGLEVLQRELGERLGLQDHAEVVREAKEHVLDQVLHSDLVRLTELFALVCARHRRYRDFTRPQLQEALRQVLVAYPVYRTYGRPDGSMGDEDRARIDAVVSAAAAVRDDLDQELFSFLGQILRFEVDCELGRELALRVQQTSGPVMAKGVEDTAFYRDVRFIAACEVGHDPRRAAGDLQRFHRVMAERARRWPSGLNALSTHDTKRSADVRARLWTLSERAGDWLAATARWSERARPLWGEIEPEPAAELLLWQTLVGAWPIPEDRLTAHLEKAAREAKTRTSWKRPDAEYERALLGLARGVLADEALRGDIERFARDLEHPGRLHALAALALQLTCPGVPDVYQGSERWDLSLVDPDNRRPVDFDGLRDLLAALEGPSWHRADSGAPKLWTLHRLLRLRHEHPELLRSGSYRPLDVAGPRADQVVAFSRGGSVCTVVRRRIGRPDWSGTRVALPDGEWRDVFTGRRRSAGPVELPTLWADHPVAVLARAR